MDRPTSWESIAQLSNVQFDAREIQAMARRLPFFRWWNHDDAPLGLALQWIASNGDRLDPHELAKSKMLNFDDRPDRPDRVDCWGPEGSGLAYALAPETIDAWQKATEKLTQEIRQNALPVTGWERSDSPRKKIAPLDLKDIKIASPAEAEGEMLMSVFDDKNLVLEFGTYDNFPYCEGDTLRKGVEILWSRLTVPVERIIELWPFPDTVEGLTDDDARALIRTAMKENGGFIGQERAAEIVRSVDPQFLKKRAMSLAKECTGNTKPGPKGPRKNVPENRA